MKDTVTDGWKYENSFKIGYLQVLEKQKMKSFSGTNLKAILYINSKIHVSKKNYSSFQTMLLCSGIGWNETTKMINIPNDEWFAYLKVILCYINTSVHYSY
ncbi:hypothetical protein Pfo_000527 [Paulownia fortunei]|nr:hypothetical protein Pfo_000527 [Paulownia fortunei]